MDYKHRKYKKMDKGEAFKITQGYIKNLKLNNIAIKKAYVFGSFAKEQ